MKPRALPLAVAIMLVLGGGVAWMECSSSTCGDGIAQSGEQCDKGTQNGMAGSGCSSSCTFANIEVATINVGYTLLKNEVPGFAGVSCADMQIGGAHVVLSGPQPVDEMWVGCGENKQYSNVMQGTYQATITLLDANMMPLSNAVSSPMTDVMNGPVTSLTVNFHQADFVKQDYVGELDWDPQWGKLNNRCGDAGVTMEAVILKDANGALVTSPAATDDGLALNGTFGPCYSASAAKPQRIAPLPWGHYTLSLEGETSAGLAFCEAFQLFVAPGSDSAINEILVDTFDPTNDAGVTCP